MHLRRAVDEYQRNPLLHEWQHDETALVLDECEHLISLLRGDSGSWSDADREWLDAFGIDEEATL